MTPPDGAGPSAPILIVEDKDSLRAMLRLALEQDDHVVLEARDEAEASVRLAAARPALVLTDLRLPAGDGLGVLRAAKEVDPELPVIVMTAYGGIEDAVSAMKSGALDFLAKPVDPDHLRLLVARALAQRRLATEHALLRDEVRWRRGAPGILGESPAIRQASAAIQRAAAGDATVLLEGESGTGKELFARALHDLGPRAQAPFVAINCAAIPDTLLEAELFGYERGAFTGATQRKPGRFELAHRGTLFLDEVGELPLGLQAKLLRVLESRSFERLGGTTTIRVDVRLVAATNKQLKSAVRSRQFREDLFFRLSVFPLVIPPLRERPGDIALLARHFIERVCREQGRPVLPLTPAAEAALAAYPWPGNVRELQNAVERAVILSDGDRLQPSHFHLEGLGAPAEAQDPWLALDLTGSLADVARRGAAAAERRAIAHALEVSGGDAARAADLLEIGFRVLAEKRKEYGV
ncbi:MAG: sigma-54-dependent transcriptional regulator [Vicinamibacterales bacterium]